MPLSHRYCNDKENEKPSHQERLLKTRQHPNIMRHLLGGRGLHPGR